MCGFNLAAFMVDGILCGFNLVAFIVDGIWLIVDGLQVRIYN